MEFIAGLILGMLLMVPVILSQVRTSKHNKYMWKEYEQLYRETYKLWQDNHSYWLKSYTDKSETRELG